MNTPPARDGAAVPRAVLDTNVWLDLLVFRDPAAEPLRAGIAQGAFTVVIDAFGLDEFARVLGYPLGRFSVPADGHAALLASCRSMSTLFERADDVASVTRAPLPLCRDPFDQPFLELARDAKARWLVTKDRDLLGLRRAAGGAGIEIVTPGECAATLAAPA